MFCGQLVWATCMSYIATSVTVIELRNENEQNIIIYSQLRKSKISFVKKVQTIPNFGISTAIMLFLDIFRRWCKLDFGPGKEVVNCKIKLWSWKGSGEL